MCLASSSRVAASQPLIIRRKATLGRARQQVHPAARAQAAATAAWPAVEVRRAVPVPSRRPSTERRARNRTNRLGSMRPNAATVTTHVLAAARAPFAIRVRGRSAHQNSSTMAAERRTARRRHCPRLVRCRRPAKPALARMQRCLAGTTKARAARAAPASSARSSRSARPSTRHNGTARLLPPAAPR